MATDELNGDVIDLNLLSDEVKEEAEKTKNEANVYFKSKIISLFFFLCSTVH